MGRNIFFSRRQKNRKWGEISRSSRRSHSNLNDLAPEPAVDIYWRQQSGQMVNEGSFLFLYHSERGKEVQ